MRDTILLDDAKHSFASGGNERDLDDVICRIIGSMPLNDLALSRKELQENIEAIIDKSLAARIRAEHPGSVRNISRILGVSRKILEKIMKHAGHAEKELSK